MGTSGVPGTRVPFASRAEAVVTDNFIRSVAAPGATPARLAVHFLVTDALPASETIGIVLPARVTSSASKDTVPGRPETSTVSFFLLTTWNSKAAALLPLRSFSVPCAGHVGDRSP